MPSKRVTPKEKTSVSSADKSSTSATNIVSVDLFKETTKALELNYQRKLNLFGKKIDEAQLIADERFKKLEDNQNRVIETIGIFAALLAFVAFEAQIFKGPLSTASLVGISAIMFGALSFFVLLLDLAFDAFKQQRNLRIALFGLATVSILLGFGFAKIGFLNNDHKEYLTSAQVEERINEHEVEIDKTVTKVEEKINKIQSNNDLLEFKNCILKEGLADCL